jgi:hypothetical protein
LIERKLKRLAALFPVIDPELATMVTPLDVETSQAKLEWLFYFDYVWIDEQMTGSGGKINYEVNIYDLKISTRNEVLNFLHKKNRTGNFIWIGANAKERLLLEAPYLSSVIEQWTLEVHEQEMTIYLIKFEELIPRVQKYYNLEQARTILKDYEPTLEGKNFLRMVEAKTAQSHSLKEINDIIETLGAFSYHGFKERDSALQITMTLFNHFQKLTGQANLDPLEMSKYRQRFTALVETIGYPGQLLHLAHSNKRSIRDIEKLCETCLDPNHARFNEAWLFLATTDISRYNGAQLRKLLALIQTSITDPRTKRQPIIKRKIIEAFFNISQHLTIADIDLIASLLGNLAIFLAEQQAGSELFCFFLDAKLSLEQKLQIALPFGPEIITQLRTYFAELYHQLGPRSAEVLSLSTRWKQVA